ncbi:MAG: Alpha-amylase 1 [Syntrophorhabdus sp. PtaU1.Bin153]|nr:MAG: Alpha-amylase 1 [Syntrophorhabdus sp. PtaU1.Bin153]
MHFILEEAYNRAYKPFFEVLKDFEDVTINLHFSGFLFSWLLENKPDYIALLKTLKERGQIEIITGGMYEPILSLLPQEDGIGQIMMHADLMEKVFGDRPDGLWLAERVYEPHIPLVLGKAGISHTLVDDNHFKAVGLTEDDLYGYLWTEHEGRRLSVFPGLEFLRYAIPFKPVEVIDGYLKSIATKQGDLAVFGDDGEKFGLWPGTYHSVYEEGWLRTFFGYLATNKDWLKTVTFSEYLSSKPAKGLVYLDCQSYKEMGEWSLPPDLSKEYGACINGTGPEGRKLLKGGYFRHFLVKYPESNDMHKKMLSVTKRAGNNEEAKHDVFMAQCNDSYWHGVFGGLYLPHLRASVYEHLIKAEKRLEPDRTFVTASMEDINMDGEDEVILNNNALKAYFLLKEGGTLYELDHKQTATNIMATLTRRYEGYHDRIKVALVGEATDGTKTIHDVVLAKEPGLDRYLHYDWHRRASLVDHVMAQDVTWDGFYRSSYVEPGDFVKERYAGSVRRGKKSVSLSMKREGHFWKGREGIPLSIEKTVRLDAEESALYVDYLVEGEVCEPFLLGVEFNFSFLGTGGERYMEIGREKLPLTIKGIFRSSRKIFFHDPYQRINATIELDRPLSIWTFPVEVVSLSETGFERNYQSTMCMPVWGIDLTAGSRSIRMKLQVNGISSYNHLQ